ncbi:BNR repeat-containing glycosyl hydrolase, partial [mine drainage metagenome]
MTTVNGGGSWSFYYTPVVAGELHSVSCPSVTVCFAVGTFGGNSFGQGGVILSTTDGGSSWNLVYSASSSSGIDSFYGVSCPSLSTCFAVGYSGLNSTSLIVATTNGGSTWNNQTVPDNQSGFGPWLDSISCPTTTTCFAASESSAGPLSNGLILTTSNGGSSWTYQSAPNND